MSEQILMDCPTKPGMVEFPLLGTIAQAAVALGLNKKSVYNMISQRRFRKKIYNYQLHKFIMPELKKGILEGELFVL